MTGTRSSLILIKLGGSLITDKAGHELVRTEVLSRLAAELVQLTEVFAGGIVLGHGSGSFGHAAASDGGWVSVGEMPSLETLARTQDAAARLHRVVVTALIEAGLSPFSLAPSSLLVSSGGRLASWTIEPLVEAVEAGLLPVLFGDVILDRQRRARVFSTERVFMSVAPLLLARGYSIRAAYWLGNTDGVLDSAGRTIGRITRADASKVLADLGESATRGVAGPGNQVRDVTGGIRHRLETAIALVRLGVPSRILDGRTVRLARAVEGTEISGTWFDPD